jgi:hypothetical protein
VEARIAYLLVGSHSVVVIATKPAVMFAFKVPMWLEHIHVADEHITITIPPPFAVGETLRSDYLDRQATCYETNLLNLAVCDGRASYRISSVERRNYPAVDGHLIADKHHLAIGTARVPQN